MYLFVLIVLLAHVSFSASIYKTLMLIDDDKIKQSHSVFIQSLINRGHDVKVQHIDEADINLVQYGQYNYDNLILFTPKALYFDANTYQDIIEYINAGKNILVAVNEHISQSMRSIALACGVAFNEKDNKVIDYVHHGKLADTSQAFYTNNIITSSIINNSNNNKVLYDGIGHSVAEQSTLIYPVLNAENTAYIGTKYNKQENFPELIGDKIKLISSIQQSNNGRAIFSGSLKLFSNRYFTSNEYNIQLSNELS